MNVSNFPKNENLNFRGKKQIAAAERSSLYSSCAAMVFRNVDLNYDPCLPLTPPHNPPSSALVLFPDCFFSLMLWSSSTSQGDCLQCTQIRSELIAIPSFYLLSISVPVHALTQFLRLTSDALMLLSAGLRSHLLPFSSHLLSRRACKFIMSPLYFFIAYLLM